MTEISGRYFLRSGEPFSREAAIRRRIIEQAPLPDEDLGELVGFIREGAAGLAGRAKDGLRVAREQVSKASSEATAAVSTKVTRASNARKDLAAAKLDRVAGVAHQTAHVLRAAKMEAAGDYAEKTATAIDGVTDYLDEGDVKKIVDDSADLLRRHPAVGVLGSLAAGILIGRFIAAGRPVREAPPAPKLLPAPGDASAAEEAAPSARNGASRSGRRNAEAEEVDDSDAGAEPSGADSQDDGDEHDDE